MISTAQKKKMLAEYRSGYSAPVDPTDAYRALERTRRAGSGTLVAGDVVDDARPEDATLHPVFEWDDYIAGEAWRKDQARLLIRNVCVVHEEGERAESRPVYVHVRPAEGPDTGGYRPVTVVMADPESRASVIADALKQLEGWQRRYGWIAEMAGIVTAIAAVVARPKPI